MALAGGVALLALQLLQLLQLLLLLLQPSGPVAGEGSLCVATPPMASPFSRPQCCCCSCRLATAMTFRPLGGFPLFGSAPPPTTPRPPSLPLSLLNGLNSSFDLAARAVYICSTVCLPSVLPSIPQDMARIQFRFALQLDRLSCNATNAFSHAHSRLHSPGEFNSKCTSCTPVPASSSSSSSCPSSSCCSSSSSSCCRWRVLGCRLRETAPEAMDRAFGATGAWVLMAASDAMECSGTLNHC